MRGSLDTKIMFVTNILLLIGADILSTHETYLLWASLEDNELLIMKMSYNKKKKKLDIIKKALCYCWY